jgi:predicted MFS family arabinose efflux permease
VPGAAIGARLGKRIAPRWLIGAGIVLSAAGLAPLIGLTPASHYLPLIFTATLIEGIGTGLGGPPMLQTSLRAVLPGDTGAAAAAGSTANQLGASIGAALLSTIAVATARAYLASHAGATIVTAAVHGYATAMAWGSGLLLVTAIPALILINAKAPSAEP